jgi:hypothetical protein
MILTCRPPSFRYFAIFYRHAGDLASAFSAKSDWGRDCILWAEVLSARRQTPSLELVAPQARRSCEDARPTKSTEGPPRRASIPARPGSCGGARPPIRGCPRFDRGSGARSTKSAKASGRRASLPARPCEAIGPPRNMVTHDLPGELQMPLAIRGVSSHFIYPFNARQGWGQRPPHEGRREPRPSVPVHTKMHYPLPVAGQGLV